MPLPSSGSISLSQIAAEFGGTAPHSLSEYYRGGGLVPDTPANALIPTSGAIKLSDFYGASAVSETVTLAASYTAVRVRVGATAQSYFTLESDGDIIRSLSNGTAQDEGDWISPKSAAPSDYEVRATHTGGDSGGYGGAALDTWLPLSSNRTWTVTQATEGIREAQLTIEIRKGSGSVLDSTVVDFYSERTGS